MAHHWSQGIGQAATWVHRVRNVIQVPNHSPCFVDTYMFRDSAAAPLSAEYWGCRYKPSSIKIIEQATLSERDTMAYSNLNSAVVTLNILYLYQG